MTTPSSSTASASPASSATSTDIKAPLWDHVLVTERAPSGGNTRWVCKYYNYNGYSSYTRVEAHLLQIKNKGVGTCPKVSFEMLTELRNEVQRCKELVERAKSRTVPMPTVPAPRDSSGNKKSKRGPVCALEKTWATQDRKHLDALIARSFYSAGVPFNFARNPYLREAFSFATSRTLTGYQMPGYNKLREGLLAEERAHIDRLLSSIKSTWHDRGVTISADGWTDPQRKPLINFVAISDSSAMFLRADN
ncbi:hypothetical protein PR202_ga04515 [Eleusine coracana subsp. coracana]|uniref:DUF659 domain-containing protein n=1 Tax=Eleusine coracana subsp. coracana TaxID=191504 RepID=A0AAV5BPV5_ELECO|nr:hypothetical protein PR202_ga04515 [Eleusine coracana subsp. coracana]